MLGLYKYPEPERIRFAPDFFVTFFTLYRKYIVPRLINQKYYYGKES